MFSVGRMRNAMTGLLALLALFTCTETRAQEDSWITCLHKSGDSEQVLPRVKLGLSCMPKSIRDALQSDGYKVTVTPFMAYEAESGDMQRRSSYDVSSINNIAGQFRSREKTVYIPERCSSGNEPMGLQN